MLALVMATGPLALYAISALAPIMTHDLELSTARLGALAFVSYGSAALSAMINGRLVDRFDPRLVQQWLFVASGVSVLLVAIAGDLLWLVMAMLVSGLAQSASNPVTNRLISERVRVGRQGTILGVKQSGVQIGQFLTGALLPPLALVAGWRWGIGSSVLLVIAGIVLTRRLLPSLPTGGGQRPRARPMGSLLDRFLVRLTIYTFANGALVTLVNVHLPLYAFEQVGLGAGAAGSLAGIIGALGIAGRIGWGHIIERVPDYVLALRGLAVVSLVSVVLLWSAAALGPLVLLAGTVLFAASALPGNAVAMFAVIRSVDSGDTGSVTGAMMVALYLGFTAGPALFGLIVGMAEAYAAGWALALVLAASSLVALLTIRN